MHNRSCFLPANPRLPRSPCPCGFGRKFKRCHGPHLAR
ncbi:SEC-C domain-containing protein [Martelella mediterranea]|nr:SEC-C domain-containing protein [Martelella mediterranea]